MNLIRPVIGWGVVCTFLDIRSVNFFLPPQDLYFTVRGGGASETAATHHCHKIENKYFQFIHKIEKKLFCQI